MIYLFVFPLTIAYYIAAITLKTKIIAMSFDHNRVYDWKKLDVSTKKFSFFKTLILTLNAALSSAVPLYFKPKQKKNNN